MLAIAINKLNIDKLKIHFKDKKVFETANIIAFYNNFEKETQKNKFVVGSQARILYADAEGRIKIAKVFNDVIKSKKNSAPLVLERDHHDVSGTDSPFRETSNIYDGSQFTADMAVQNLVDDSMVKNLF